MRAAPPPSLQLSLSLSLSLSVSTLLFAALLLGGPSLACAPSTAPNAARPEAMPTAPARTSPAAPRITDLSANAEPLRTQFNEDAGHPRLLMLLSPT